ncbi:protein FAM47E [Struthio camelus]|uniref:protein FAM47E n=1 Tax=Struthio camelus TaxID=8801 RepID=UPI0036041194
MSSNYFRKSKLTFSDSLNSQRWIFLKKGLDDFRDGFPPSSDNTIVYGTKRTVPIILKNNTLKSFGTAEWKERKKCKTQVCLSKLSPLQQARRNYVAQLLQEVIGVLYPEMHLSGKIGYNDSEQENQPLQMMQGDERSKATDTQIPSLSKESRGKNACIWLTKKKEVAAREKVAKLNDFALIDENIKRATKHFCDWVMSLGGGNCNIDEDTLMNLFSTSCESKVTLPTPFHIGKLRNMQAEQPKSQEVSPLWAAVKSSHRIRHLPCHIKELSQPKQEKIRYGSWYLDPKMWRKWKGSEPLKALETAGNSLGNGKHQFEKMEIAQLHSTLAFNEFLERKGYRKPQFLLKMLAGRNDSGAQEETSKACKLPCPKRHDKTGGDSSRIVE